MANPENWQQDEEKQTKPKHNMCWTPLYENKHKQHDIHRYDITHPRQ